ncbi:hypothetical protein, partial [Dongia deserti]
SGSGQTITLVGTPNFSGAFVQAQDLAYVAFTSITWSGSATGTRYNGSGNSIIQTAGGGATYLPGNAAGTTSTGAQYL